MTPLLVYPTHKNCSDNALTLMGWGIHAVCYPARTTVATPCQAQNCWNRDADAAEGLGFPVVKTICTTCPHRERCRQDGYLQQLVNAVDAEVALATHERAAAGGLRELVRERDYVSIHENAVGILRPACRITLPEIRTLQQVVHTMLQDPRWLDWFGDDQMRDEDGNRVSDAERKIQRKRQCQATRDLGEMLDVLASAVSSAEKSQVWSPTHVRPTPQGLERSLFRATREARVRLDQDPWQFVLGAFTGELAAAVILVRTVFSKAVDGPSQSIYKSVFGVRRNAVPPGRTVWFSDATLHRERLSRLVGGTVTDATPGGTLPLRKMALQHTKDVTRSTSPKVVRALLRGVLLKRNAQAVGVITHRDLLGALERLEPPFRSRIAATTYFHSGEDRSSNDWHERCDLLIVLGTPRVPPSAVIEYLIQVGELDAACQEPSWGDLSWHGETESGADVRVSGRGYQNDAWRSAHQDLVRSTLVQAVGRGRGLLEDGCDVVVFSNEECGLTVADGPAPWLNEQGAAIWDALRELTDTKPKRTLLEKVSVRSGELAQRLGMQDRTVRRGLADLEALGASRRVGPRSGWELIDTAAAPEHRACVTAEALTP